MALDSAGVRQAKQEPTTEVKEVFHVQKLQACLWNIPLLQLAAALAHCLPTLL